MFVNHHWTGPGEGGLDQERVDWNWKRNILKRNVILKKKICTEISRAECTIIASAYFTPIVPYKQLSSAQMPTTFIRCDLVYVNTYDLNAMRLNHKVVIIRLLYKCAETVEFG